MALQTIFDALSNALIAAGIDCEKGAEHLGDNTAPPRVVIFPTEEGFAPVPPRFVGPPRVLHMRGPVIRADIWGKDWNDAERVLQTFVYLLRAAVGTSYQIVSGRWPQQDGAAIVQLGRKYVLEFRLAVPLTVPDGAEGQATVTTADTTDTTLPFDGTVLAP